MWWLMGAAWAAIPSEAWQWNRDASWPTLDPTGTRIAWIDGVAPAAESDLCLSSVATPFDCVSVARVPTGSDFDWADANTVVVWTDTAWTTCVQSGCAAWTPLREGERAFAWHGHVQLENTAARPYPLDGRWFYEAGQDAPVGSWAEGRLGAGTLYTVTASGKADVVVRPRTSGRVVEQSWQAWKPASYQSWRGGILAFDGEGPRSSLVRIDLATGEERRLFAPQLGPVSDLWQDTTDGRPLAVAERWSRTTWHAIEPTVAEDVAWLEAHVDGDFHPVDANADQPVWLLLVWSGEHVAQAMLYHRASHTLTRAPPHFGPSEEAAWRPTETPEVLAPDGLNLPTYLTRPDPDRFGPGPYPAVLWVHGGPWGSGSFYGFQEIAQAFADLGLAYVVVDYRGSAGYGRAHADAAAGAIGREIQTDLYAAIDTLVAQGAVDPARIGWLGVDSGGYAVLQAATTQPDHLACGVSYAGPPKLNGGPASDPRDVSRPLLLVQGSEDREVRPSRVRKFADKAVEAGAPVTMVELPGVGHDFGEPAAQVFPLVTTFLADCLGVPIEDPVVPPQLVFEVRHDAARVRGLPTSP